MNVLVLCGGDSSERSISLLSGQNMYEALIAAGYETTMFDPSTADQPLASAVKGYDIILPILHGTGGEDGALQKELESLGTPFIGSSSAVSAACFDKWQTMQMLPDILFPKTELVTSETIYASPLLKKPFVIKPRAEGSSVDVFIVRDVDQFAMNTELADAFTRHTEMMIEELIPGQEMTVGVLGDEALPVVEIIPPSGKEFDFTNKYNGATAENCPPLFISDAIQAQARRIAFDVHTTMGCKDFSRADMIVTPNGEIYTLEINTLPGMTKESLLPRAAQAMGYSMADVVTILVKNNL